MVQIYTSFSYNGVGVCRRIKDELVELLAKEGKTWGQVVDEAVEKYSLKEAENKPPTLDRLVTEAEELKSYLGLGDQSEDPSGEKREAGQQKAHSADIDLEGASEASVL